MYLFDMIRLYTFYVLMFFVCLFSCQSSKKEEKTLAEATTPIDKIDLTTYGLDIALNTPQLDADIENEVNETPQGISVYKGNEFKVNVFFDGDLATKIQELKEDALFKNEIVEKTDNYIIYKASLPDDSKSYFHFYGVQSSESEVYEISNVHNPDQPFSENQIKKMVETIFNSSADS